MEKANPKKEEMRQFSGSALVVDDNSVNLIVAVNVLKKYGLDTAKASSGAQALEMLSDVRFDLLFLDLRMPKMNGLEVLEKIRANPELYDQKMPVIILTASEEAEMEELRNRLEELGIAGFLGKPIDRRALEEVLEVCLGSGDAGNRLLPPDELMTLKECLSEKHYREGEKLLKRLLMSPAGEEERRLLALMEEAYRDFDFEEALRLCRELTA